MRQNSVLSLVVVGVLVLMGISCAQDATQAVSEPPGPNVALGAPYTMTAPNYALCADADDATQLTDGEYSQGHFWTRKTTVGWSGSRNVFVTIDLGQVQPIAGLSFNTAAGVADVRWPSHIVIFVSDDGNTWHGLGDLMELYGRENLPEYGTYTVLRIFTHNIRAHGRFVQLAMQPGEVYLFADEIEVYRGPDELLTAELPGPAVTDVPAHLNVEFFGLMIREQLRRDLEAVRDSIAAPGLSSEQRAAFETHIHRLTQAIKEMPVPPIETFRAVLPMNDLEREIFRLQAEVWRAQGKPELRVWQTHRWEHLVPWMEPAADGPAAAIDVRMMNGEVRAEVVNFTNAGEEDGTLRLRIDGLPGGDAADYITVYEVLHVGTRRFESVAAALPQAEQDGADWLINAPAGMTVQAWVQFRPENLDAGKYSGTLTVSGIGGMQAKVPTTLVISSVRFPERTSLLVGGWDYTERDSQYGVTPQNRDAVIEYLQDMRVNVTWGTAAVTPSGTFGEDNQLVEPPDTTQFDRWVRDWPTAERYMVFLAKTDSFAGAAMGSADFEMRLGNWARFWSRHMRDLGLEPGQLGILIYDEPHDERGYAINEQWARAINAAAPELLMFVDPQPGDPEKPLAMFEQMDVLCPHRPQWLGTKWFPGFFAAQREKGKELWFYSADGPARRFDPYAYYLAQAWHIFAEGGRGSSFWAFTDTGRVSVWNEYATAGRGPYCPYYLDDTSVTSGKWMEAVRESAQDFEYLTMLRDRVAALDAAGRGEEEAVRHARQLLEDGPSEVLAGDDGRNYTWDQPRDRAAADRVRERILDALETL
ncbi:MAG: discoidin domain-containing protein [Armatimonadetes bacterium]|nr:discoidin domain-containing protein [Armatimonadota bacterium]